MFPTKQQYVNGLSRNMTKDRSVNLYRRNTNFANGFKSFTPQSFNSVVLRLMVKMSMVAESLEEGTSPFRWARSKERRWGGAGPET